MLVQYLSIFIIFQFFNFIKSQNNATNSTNPTNQTNPTPTPEQLVKMYKDICMPTPIAFDLLSPYQPDCRALQTFPSNETKFYCCEVEFQQKKNASAPKRRGCISILTNYIDNDRYEDFIDYIERGKIDLIRQYSIFLGKSAYEQFEGFIPNNTKNNVYKFDCISKYLNTKYYVILTLVYLIFGIV